MITYVFHFILKGKYIYVYLPQVLAESVYTIFFSLNMRFLCYGLQYTQTVIRFSCSVMFDSLQPHGVQNARSITNSRSLLKLKSIKSVMPSNHRILCHPLLLLPSIFPTIRVFSNESVLCIRWPKYWSFSYSISPSNEYSGLISFRMDWLDLLAVQGTLKSLLQHHSSKASILLCSAFFIVQLSLPYMITGKAIALARWTFVDKVMSLLSSDYNEHSAYYLHFYVDKLHHH